MSKKLLLTGGAGFIGHHTFEHIMKNTDWMVMIIDGLNYAGNLNRITDIKGFDDGPKFKNRLEFLFHDLRVPFSRTEIVKINNFKPDYVLHMAAETHVDRSLNDPATFVNTNILGTVNLLEMIKRLYDKKLSKFICVSTDEVYGSVSGDTLHVEGSKYRPSNPYAASKASAELFCEVYRHVNNIPIIITNTMNNFGERQDPEKLIPSVVKSILLGKNITLHVKSGPTMENTNISSRCWIHARSHADALLFLLKNGVVGEKYNVAGERLNVLEMANMIFDIIGKKTGVTFEDFHTFRLGHDMHYGLDCSKIKSLGWKQKKSLHDSLEKTIKWMISEENLHWLELNKEDFLSFNKNGLNKRPPG